MADIWQECIECGRKYGKDEIVYRCKDDGSILDIKYDYDSIDFSIEKARKRELGVWRYEELMPVKKRVSLGEGGTNLYRLGNVSRELGIKDLWAKNEGENPTGSFKDRGMTVGVSKAIELGIKSVGCASTGNTSASLSAYSARSGLNCVIIVPAKKIAFGKLAQALVYGAKVFSVKSNFDEAMRLVAELANTGRIYLLNSINPYRLEGQKTLGFEIYDVLGEVPDRIIIPVGNAGNISAVWKAFNELKTLGITDRLPIMCGIQAEGAAPLVHLFKEGGDKLVPVEAPETKATAIRIGNPVSWAKAIRAVKESGGLMESVSDSEIVKAQKFLASKEGIFVEPASASSIAGLFKLKESGDIKPDEKTVCITTGHGLKDPNIIVDSCRDMIVEVDNLDQILAHI